MLIVARLALAIRVCLRLRLSRRNGSVHDLVKIGQRGVVLAGCRDNSDSTPSTGTCSCSSSRSAISTICSLAIAGIAGIDVAPKAVNNLDEPFPQPGHVRPDARVIRGPTRPLPRKGLLR